MSIVLKKSSWTSKKNAALANYRFMPDTLAEAALTSTRLELTTTQSGQTTNATRVNKVKTEYRRLYHLGLDCSLVLMI